MGFVLEEPVRVTRRVRVLGYVVLVLVVFLVWVIAKDAHESAGAGDDPPTAAQTVNGTTLLQETEPFEGDVAGVGFGGRLVVLPGGCLGFDETGSSPVLVVFPPGTKLVGAGRGVAVRVPGHPSGDPRWPARTVRPGDVIGSGSRFSAPVSPSEYGGGLSEHTPDACRRYPAMNIDPGV